MKKNGWKFIPLLLALVLAASFLGCSKEEEENSRPTVGNDTSVEQYTFDGISAPSSSTESTEPSTEPSSRSSSGGSYIGGGSYLSGYQAASNLPTLTPYQGGGSTTSASSSGGSSSNESGGFDLISQALGGFTGAISMDNIGEITDYLKSQGLDPSALGIDIAQFVSGIVDDKENGETQSAGNILDGVGEILGDIMGGTAETTGK